MTKEFMRALNGIFGECGTNSYPDGSGDPNRIIKELMKENKILKLEIKNLLIELDEIEQRPRRRGQRHAKD